LLILKKNQENPTLEPDALAELLMLSAISLLVSELPDILITAIINPVGELCLIRRKTPAFRPQKPLRVDVYGAKLHEPFAVGSPERAKYLRPGPRPCVNVVSRFNSPL
jgi:hypothetical protein